MIYRVLLADDHIIIRQGLKQLLEREDWLEVVGEAEDGRQTVQLASQLVPDLVILDIGMPELNGIEAARKIKQQNPGIKILALSIHSGIQFIQEMFSAGASGYLLKDCAVDELIQAASTILKGEKYLSPSINKTVRNKLEQLESKNASAYTILSEREKEVLQLIAEGNSTKQIADKLFLSPKTVEAHRKHIMDKLEIYNLPGLTQYAIKSGIIHIS